MAKQIQTISRVGAPEPMSALLMDVYAWREGMEWKAKMPELDGAEVGGASTSSAALTKLSGLIGQIVLSHRGKDTQPKLNAAHGFSPPDGAIHRQFSVGSL